MARGAVVFPRAHGTATGGRRAMGTAAAAQEALDSVANSHQDSLHASTPGDISRGHGDRARVYGPSSSEVTRVPTTGSLAHIDISVGYPDKSIPFYAAFFGALGYRRREVPMPDWQGSKPSRATWGLEYPSGARFDVEIRPARPESRDRKYDRYEPGPHHLAFHAKSREVVQRVYEVMLEIGATVLDLPADYTGQPGYDDGYYAAFFADPDGIKLEVAHIPRTNP